MKKKWILVAFLSSMVALTACTHTEKVSESPKPKEEQGVKVEEKKTESKESTTTVSTKKASIQSKIPFNDLYPDPEVRKYAEKFIGIEAPDFTLKNTDGKSISLSDFKGKNVIVEMAETTCSACQNSQPKLNEFQKANSDVVFIQVFNEPADTVKGYLSSYKITDTERVLVGDANKVFSDYEVSYVPTLLFVDKEGVIKLVHVGQVEDQDVLKLYTELAFQ
jgi:peroxiredoxin